MTATKHTIASVKAALIEKRCEIVENELKEAENTTFLLGRYTGLSSVLMFLDENQFFWGTDEKALEVTTGIVKESMKSLVSFEDEPGAKGHLQGCQDFLDLIA